MGHMNEWLKKDCFEISLEMIQAERNGDVDGWERLRQEKENRKMEIEKGGSFADFIREVVKMEMGMGEGRYPTHFNVYDIVQEHLGSDVLEKIKVGSSCWTNDPKIQEFEMQHPDGGTERLVGTAFHVLCRHIAQCLPPRQSEILSMALNLDDKVRRA